MTESENAASPSSAMEKMQHSLDELKLQGEQAAAERGALEAENKALRFLIERLIEHRQRSHGDLVNFLADLVSRLPVNDVGLLVSRLVEHKEQVTENCTAMLKGKVAEGLPQPALLKNLEVKKSALKDAIKPAVEELIALDTSFEKPMLESLIADSDLFFTPGFIRANRCFVKGQLPRERVLREFGEEALALFKDLTTDKRFNPRPKPEEIVLGFRDDFDGLLSADAALKPEVKEALQSLQQKVQRGKARTDEAKAQRAVFAKLSFLLELLHYYENQNTEAPDAVFAQRLPATVEQLAVSGATQAPEEAMVARSEELLQHIMKPEHWHMVVNNLGKGGGSAKTLKYVLSFRVENVVDLEHLLTETVRHLIPTTPHPIPTPAELVKVIGLIPPDMQRLLVGSIMSSDRRRREKMTELGRAVAKELGLKGLDEAQKTAEVPPDVERRLAWEDVKTMVKKREDAATIADTIRERLHTKYDVDEVKESWLALIEADAISFIRIFCQLPYLASGKTDPIAHAVMQVYLGRLLHEKYADTGNKVMTSLKNMFKANPTSPTLVNFMAMVKWADADAAKKISADIGMPAS